jgi:acetyltransferase-like isoleucine patch superfamily enzyme
MIKKLEIDDNLLVGEEIEIGGNVSLGHRNLIIASRISIGEYVSVGSNNQVLISDDFIVGNTTYVGNSNLIEGKKVRIGNNVWWGDENIVGHGGKWGSKSELELGSFSMVVGKCILNLSDKIAIGENVGIGGEVNIWTHGSYLSILDGFPAQYGPVTIGSYVWLPARCIVLPNITVGSNVVIGNNSLVNMNIPSGCLAGGIPIRIIKENCYPKVDDQTIDDQLCGIIKDYEQLAHYKNLKVKVSYLPERRIILCNDKPFNLRTMEFPDELSEEEEDFRDYLRRRGVKFFGKKPFKSILPPKVQLLKEFYEKSKSE